METMNGSKHKKIQWILEVTISFILITAAIYLAEGQEIFYALYEIGVFQCMILIFFALAVGGIGIEKVKK